MAYLSAATKTLLAKKLRFANDQGIVDILSAIDTAIGAAVDGLGQDNIALLEQDISAGFVEAEVQAISDKVDAILTALIASGIIAAA